VTSANSCFQESNQKQPWEKMAQQGKKYKNIEQVEGIMVVHGKMLECEN
jgi:hypothetical protein